MKQTVTRRDMLRTVGLGVATLTAAPIFSVRAQDKAAAGHKLAPLPYGYDALEPHLDARTMEIHHGRHHQTYVTNLNKALEGRLDLLSQPVEDLLKNLNDIPEAIRTAVRNNGGGHANHTLYWSCMKPGGGGEPSGALAQVISKKFGNFAAFKTLFSDAAMKRFGSGWAWLARDKAGELQVLSTPNQESPLSGGLTPLLTLDVWEHAYYLKYQNKRADYVAAWWNVVNWDAVASALAA
jgi:Fe-Mn family superoxide dismutase